MKQHITVKQLNELSLNAKNKLRKWWTPTAGDVIVCKYPSTYLFYGGKEEKSRLIPILLTNQISDSGFYGWSINDSFPGKVDKNYYEAVEGQKNRALEILADALPLLSICRMIEFLASSNELDLFNYKDMITLEDADHLCDWLWDDVKTVIEGGSLRT